MMNVLTNPNSRFLFIADRRFLRFRVLLKFNYVEHNSGLHHDVNLMKFFMKLTIHVSHGLQVTGNLWIWEPPFRYLVVISGKKPDDITTVKKSKVNRIDFMKS
ncbi:unnamed protein product [Lactuca saligna]|uniref:Uncharacterized protein n=1 Tax=Lactuca saligna TaxID=75948 RepID=A0AA35Y9A1_LACSI|nr:unnamed protein product [Lactuca saligna]